jgi:hypothetical protein
MAVALKLTRKQSTRLEQLAEAEKEIRVTDWHPEYEGPVIRFVATGAFFVVTRDGGLQRL